MVWFIFNNTFLWQLNIIVTQSYYCLKYHKARPNLHEIKKAWFDSNGMAGEYRLYILYSLNVLLYLSYLIWNCFEYVVRFVVVLFFCLINLSSQDPTTMYVSWAPLTESCWSPMRQWHCISTAMPWWMCFLLKLTAVLWCWHQVNTLLYGYGHY